MDAADGITDRRPHGRSHVPNRHGEEDAGEVSGNSTTMRHTRGGVRLGS